MMKENGCALFDTGVFIRLLNENEELHKNAYDYFRYFLEHDIAIKISTIAMAEYCVKGDAEDLPLKNVMVLPFNYNHAIQAGKMMSVVYKEKQRRGGLFPQRAIIPNDTKMFAQAEAEDDIFYYVTADSESEKIYDILKEANKCGSFKFINISVPCCSTFGVLDFD